jgi:hypothetical protein
VLLGVVIHGRDRVMNLGIYARLPRRRAARRYLLREVLHGLLKRPGRSLPARSIEKPSLRIGGFSPACTPVVVVGRGDHR